MSARLYMGRLARDVRETDIERLFRNSGPIREVLIKNGYGFIEFREPRDAEDVIREFSGRDFMGERLILEYARGIRGAGGPAGGPRMGTGPPTRSEHRLVIGNLPQGISWQDLKDLARQAGDVAYTDVNRSNGEGYVEFRYPEDMKDAIRKLDGTEYRGNRISAREDTSSVAPMYSDRRRSRSPPPRRDDNYRDDYRRDAYRRDEPRRDDYRRDEPRRDDYRRDEPRRDDYRRDDQPRRPRSRSPPRAPVDDYRRRGGSRSPRSPRSTGHVGNVDRNVIID